MVSTNLETWWDVKNHLLLLKDEFNTSGLVDDKIRAGLVEDLLSMMRRHRVDRFGEPSVTLIGETGPDFSDNTMHIWFSDEEYKKLHKIIGNLPSGSRIKATYEAEDGVRVQCSCGRDFTRDREDLDEFYQRERAPAPIIDADGQQAARLRESIRTRDYELDKSHFSIRVSAVGLDWVNVVHNPRQSWEGNDRLTVSFRKTGGKIYTLVILGEDRHIDVHEEVQA